MVRAIKSDHWDPCVVTLIPLVSAYAIISCTRYEPDCTKETIVKQVLLFEYAYKQSVGTKPPHRNKKLCRTPEQGLPHDVGGYFLNKRIIIFQGWPAGGHTRQKSRTTKRATPTIHYLQGCVGSVIIVCMNIRTLPRNNLSGTTRHCNVLTHSLKALNQGRACQTLFFIMTT